MNLLAKPIRLPAIALRSGAQAEADKLLEAARSCPPVDGPEGLQVVTVAGRALRAHLAEVETARKSLGAPLRAALEAINGIARDYSAPLARELDRLQSAIADYQREEARKALEAEAERQRALAAAETARQEAIRAQVAADGDISAEIKAEIAAARAGEVATELLSSGPVTAPKAQGVALGKRLRWEVLDIHELYKARPDLVRLEPNAREILTQCSPEIPVPGLRLWWEETATIRR